MAQKPVTIEIDGLKKREVLSIRYSLHRPVQQDGHSYSIASIDNVYVRVKALEPANNDLAGWMVSPHEYKDGKVVYMSSDRNKLLKEIKFTKAYLVFYQESYDEGMGIIEEFELSTQELDMAGASFMQSWSDEVV